MTGISDVTIRYQRRYIDDIPCCNMLIAGNTTTPSTGQYSIVRRVVGSNDVYPMYIFNSTSTEKERFELLTPINIEGTYSEVHPTTGDETDIYIEQNGVQIGDAYRFTVERCRTEYEDLYGLGIVAAGIGLIYVLFRIDLWASDNPVWRK